MLHCSNFFDILLLRRKPTIDYVLFLVQRNEALLIVGFRRWVFLNLRFDLLLNDRNVRKRGFWDDGSFVTWKQANEKGTNKQRKLGIQNLHCVNLFHSSSIMLFGFTKKQLKNKKPNIEDACNG